MYQNMEVRSGNNNKVGPVMLMIYYDKGHRLTKVVIYVENKREKGGKWIIHRVVNAGVRVYSRL